MFCDASQYAYAAVAYLKVSDTKGSFKTSIVMGKSRVAPQATIPRLELSAAVTGARLYQKIVDELSFTDITPYFWTGSMCVLRYIQNTRSAFKIFVANRLEIITTSQKLTDGFTYQRNLTLLMLRPEVSCRMKLTLMLF